MLVQCTCSVCTCTCSVCTCTCSVCTCTCTNKDTYNVLQIIKSQYKCKYT